MYLTAALQALKGCFGGGNDCESTATSRFVRTPPSAALYVGVVCNAARSPTTPTGDRSRGSVQALATLYSAVVSLRDDSAPGIADPAGALLSGGWLSGKQAVHVDAADNSGIGPLWITDGANELLASNSVCDSTQLIPCPQGSGDFVVDTTPLKPDGPHTLTFEARDAAGNVAHVDREVLIDNSPPGPPDQLTSAAGDGWSRTNAFNVTWRNPGDDGGAPVTGAESELCPASGGDCQTASSDGPQISSLDGIAVPGRGDWLLRVWLRDAAANAGPRQRA